MTDAAGPQSTPAQRWLARLSLVLAGLAILILVFAGLKSLAMLAVGAAAAVVSLAAAYFFLSRRGIWRWLSLAVFVLAPIALIIVYASRDLLWIAIVSAAAWLLASITARPALAGEQTDWRMPERPAQPPARPWPTGPICSAWPAATAPRPWWPASRPSTASRSW